ncbi:hypothetical protein ACFL5V_05930 [Fibrobacterota bacterium]
MKGRSCAPGRHGMKASRMVMPALIKGKAFKGIQLGHMMIRTDAVAL